MVTVTITVDLTTEQADALSQLCKRFRFDHAQGLSNPRDGGRERDSMISAIGLLGHELAASGYDPR